MSNNADAVIIGAGASGLMCALEAGKRGRSVILIDHQSKPGKKIKMSGGGKCNFTNLDLGAEFFISKNPHFCKSALARYTQWNIIDLLNRHNISYEEREHGQLFTVEGASLIYNALIDECKKAGVKFQFSTEVRSLEKEDAGFHIATNHGNYNASSVVIATGGLSYPRSGASDFGFQIAHKFKIQITPPHPGLVPLVFSKKDQKIYSELSGIALDCTVNCSNISFRENILFTHKGLSGPAILQISNYWIDNDTIYINFLPDLDIELLLNNAISEGSSLQLKTFLGKWLPRKLSRTLLGDTLSNTPLKQLDKFRVQKIKFEIQNREFHPFSKEGYNTAEVMLGGIATNEISSKSMESNSISGLFFTGEILDVTGHLGGYNLQWAWSSGWCAGQYV